MLSWWRRRGVDGRSKLRSSQSGTENPLLGRHKRDTSSTSDQRRSTTVSPGDADRLYSCVVAGSWSQSLCHAGPAGLPTASELVFHGCATANNGSWLFADACDTVCDRRNDVDDNGSLQARSAIDNSLSSTPALPPYVQVSGIFALLTYLFKFLTRWRSLLSYGYSYKASCARSG